MKKETVVNAGISEEIASFVMSKERDNRTLNQEGIEIGDKFTIIGIADKPSEQSIEGKMRKWVDVLTTGDRQTISIARLVGTSKRNKYFDKTKRAGENEDGELLVELSEDFTSRKLLELPNREADALVEVATNHINKTYECVGIARECGQYNATFLLFAEV